MPTASVAMRDVMMRHAPRDGAHQTAIAGLRLHRHSRPIEVALAQYEPSMCLLVQGSKRVLLGGQVHVYDTTRHLVASQYLPATGQVLKATPESPYLCVELAIGVGEVAELLAEIGEPVMPPDARRRRACTPKTRRRNSWMPRCACCGCWTTRARPARSARRSGARSSIGC